MATGTELATRFFTGNSATYDPLATFSTLWLDALWKRQILKRIPEGSKLIIDQGCGTGILTVQIARRFPQCRVVGVELRDEYLAMARQKGRDLQLNNVEFVLGRAEDVVLAEGSVDCITSSYLAKYVDLDRLIFNAHHMLRKDGTLILHELTCPANPIFLSLWKLHFKFLQTYGVWRYPEWQIPFRELPALLQESRWVDWLLDALKTNFFSDIRLMPLIFQVAAIIIAKR